MDLSCAQYFMASNTLTYTNVYYIPYSCMLYNSGTSFFYQFSHAATTKVLPTPYQIKICPFRQYIIYKLLEKKKSKDTLTCNTLIKK